MEEEIQKLKTGSEKVDKVQEKLNEKETELADMESRMIDI